MVVGGDMKLKGSFTVEASFVFPLILFVLITLLFIALYMHEITCLQAIAHRVSACAQVVLEDTNKENCQQVISEEVERLAKRDLILKQGRVKVVCQITQGLVSSHLDLNIQKEFMTPFKAVNQLMNSSRKSSLQMEVRSSTQLIDPTHIIRGIDFIDDVSSEITVTKKLKEKYSDIIDQLETIIDDWV